MVNLEDMNLINNYISNYSSEDKIKVNRSKTITVERPFENEPQNSKLTSQDYPSMNDLIPVHT